MIKKKQVLAWLCAVLMAALPAACGAEDGFACSPERIEAAADSVVLVEVFDRNGERISAASGFAAFEPAVLVTAWHAVENMAWMQVTRDDGTAFRVDHLLDCSEAADIVLCSLPEDAGLAPLPVCAEPPLRGEPAVVISSRAGVLNMVTAGCVSGFWEASGSTWLLYTAPVSAGSSGAPVLNSRGEVVGVVTGTYDRLQGIHLAAPAGELLKLEE